MITNIENYKSIEEIYYMLERLEIAYQTGDEFSIGVITTRLKALGYNIEIEEIVQ